MKVFITLASLQLIRQSLQSISDATETSKPPAQPTPLLQQTAVGNTSKCVDQTFYWVNLQSEQTVIAKCQSCNVTDTNGLVLDNKVDCWPGPTFFYKNNDYAVHAYNTTNYSSSDSKQRYFTSDCKNPYLSVSEDCNFDFSCTKQPWMWFGFDCFFNIKNTSTVIRPRNYYTWDPSRSRYLQAQCYFQIFDSKRPELEYCTPLNYTWITANKSVRSMKLFNASSPDNLTTFFGSDCTGPELSDCFWGAGCTKSLTEAIGYNCWVFSGKAPGELKWITFENWDPDRNIMLKALCSYNNIPDRLKLSCDPLEYDYGNRTDTIVLVGFVRNTTTGQLDQTWKSDCGGRGTDSYKNCFWYIRCYAREWNEVPSCTLSNPKGEDAIKTTIPFKYNLGFGNDWCGNCTQKIDRYNDTSISCAECLGPAEYTALRCKNIVNYFPMSWGGNSCANCTSCNSGFFDCVPCGYNGNQAKLKSWQRLLKKMFKTKKRSGRTNRALRAENH